MPNNEASKTLVASVESTAAAMGKATLLLFMF